MTEEGVPVKKTVRRKIQQSQTIEDKVSVPLPTTSVINPFDDLIKQIAKLQSEYNRLQQEITQTRAEWIKELENHKLELEERNKQEEIKREREQEEYDYETTRAQKKIEDEFADKKAAWEKHLQNQQEVIAKEREELALLRKSVSSFEPEKDQAVKQAQETLAKQLNEKFGAETRLREQQVKSEKELSDLKITSLTADNSRLVREVESLKIALDKAQNQVKEIAVKVIESGSNTAKIPTSSVTP